MRKWDRTSLAALLTALCLLVTAAFYPPAPQAAWWCTAFSVTCREMAAPQQSQSAGGQTVEYRWKLAEWWRARTAD